MQSLQYELGDIKTPPMASICHTERALFAILELSGRGTKSWDAHAPDVLYLATARLQALGVRLDECERIRVGWEYAACYAQFHVQGLTATPVPSVRELAPAVRVRDFVRENYSRVLQMHPGLRELVESGELPEPFELGVLVMVDQWTLEYTTEMMITWKGRPYNGLVHLVAEACHVGAGEVGQRYPGTFAYHDMLQPFAQVRELPRIEAHVQHLDVARLHVDDELCRWDMGDPREDPHPNPIELPAASKAYCALQPPIEAQRPVLGENSVAPSGS